MEIELQLNSSASDIDEILDFKNYISRFGGNEIQSISVPKVVKERGTMSNGTLLPIVTLVLQSTVVAASIKGLFDVIKNYFDLKKQGLVSKQEERKLLFTTEINGKKVIFEFHSFDPVEREHFLKIVENAASR